ncbi:MAG: hypothetical protein ACWGOV_01630 [Acidiferrobacterales bacterium]
MRNTFLLAILGIALAIPAYGDKPDHAKGKSLPPGLQKKMERGGTLPPGWERKLKKGTVLDPQVYAMARPIDDSLRVHLPVGPNGTVDLQVEGKIVRIYVATRIIQAVFNVP